jgi:hypothetical protein
MNTPNPGSAESINGLAQSSVDLGRYSLISAVISTVATNRLDVPSLPVPCLESYGAIHTDHGRDSPSLARDTGSYVSPSAWWTSCALNHG